MPDNNTKTKRIAFVIEKFTDIPIGGEPAINLNLINFLKTQGYNIDVYCKVYEKSDEITSPHNVYSDFFSNREKYINEICSGQYDLIVGSKFALKFSEIKADIYTIHSHSDLYVNKARLGFWHNFIKPKQKRSKTEIKNLISNNTAKYIFCSEQLAQDYSSLGGIKSYTVLQPYPNWTPQEGKTVNKVFTYGISATGFQNKGGYLLLKAMFLLKLSGEKFKLKIIYKKRAGILQNLLITILGLKNQVEFLPKQADMHNFFNSIDCLVMPSFIESFGMVAVEGLFFDLPVIVSSSSGAKILIENGKNGFVVDFKRNKLWNLYHAIKQVQSAKFKENFKIDKSNFMTKDRYNKEFLETLLALKGGSNE